MGKVSRMSRRLVRLTFILKVQDNKQWIQQEEEVEVDSELLKYSDLVVVRDIFLEKHKIQYQNYMYYTTTNGQTALIDNQFEISVQELNTQYEGCLFVIIQSFASRIKDQLYQQILLLRQQIRSLNSRIDELCDQREQNMGYIERPLLKSKETTIKLNNQMKLDVAILFSEPLFDESKNKAAQQPVDFRSEIERLQSTLKTTPREQIRIKCMRATIQNIKYLIRSLNPKILHIISHGRRDGSLQFEDDSPKYVGVLRIVTVEDIKDNLMELKSQLPQIVFVNTCYSETIGKTFHELGVKYVVTIDSAESIEDQAAQIFSEHFYRNVFKGETPKRAFESAKKEVEMKHNSHGCCCNHSSKEQHMPDCLWKQLKNQLGRDNAHKMFHVPSQECKCELKNYNRHDIACKWASRSLFRINRHFRKKDQVTGEYRIPQKSEVADYLFKDKLMVCCCIVPGKTPHSQSHKFKFLSNVLENAYPLYTVTIGSFTPQIIDETDQQITEVHQNFPKQFYGRQQQLYKFLKQLKNSHNYTFIVCGITGVGRTSFAIKAAQYCIERRIFQLFFYIDLYFVKNRDMFRYKFYEITKFKYDGKTITPSLKDKKMIVIFDNCDQFYHLNQSQFYQEMSGIKAQLTKSTIIIIFKKQTCSSFQRLKLLSQLVEVQPFTPTIATQMFYFKLRHQLDISVGYYNVFNLIKNKQEAKCPKVIQSICQSFSGKPVSSVTLSDIQQGIKMVGKGENAISNLINNNLEKLKQKSYQSYQMLLFLSQFSYGLTIADFQMFGSGNREGSRLQLPIRKNWLVYFQNLFESNEKQGGKKIRDYMNTALIKEQSSPDVNLQSSKLTNSSSNLNLNLKHQKSDYQSEDEKFAISKFESYYIEQIGKDRFVVKKFIRDYIWTKYTNDANHYMKFIFISFMTILMENIIQDLQRKKYVHQSLLSYNATSISGAFSMQTTISSMVNTTTSLTQSARFAQQFQDEIQKILNQNKALQQKIKDKDPSLFLADHKQDLLNIYDYKWSDVYFYLIHRLKNESQKIYMVCLENLLFYIPTALKITKVQPSLLLHTINSSLNILSQMRKSSKVSRNIKIYLKLSLMKIQCKVQQMKPNKNQIDAIFKDLQNTLSQFSDQFTSRDEIQIIRSHINYEKSYMDLYFQYICSKNDTKLTLKHLQESLHEVGDTNEIRLSKKGLLMALMFESVFKNTNIIDIQKYSLFSKMKLKNQMQVQILKLLTHSIEVFKRMNFFQLVLKAKLAKIQICWDSFNEKIKNKTFVNQTIPLNELKDMILQCQAIYHQKSHKLGGFTEFDYRIKKLTRQINEKIWENSKNTIIFMRATPIWKEQNQNYKPILQNLVRKKHHFRLYLEKIMKQKVPFRKEMKQTRISLELKQTLPLRHFPSSRERKGSYQEISLDISTRFQTLTKKKLWQEAQNGCSIMCIKTDARISKDGQIWLIFEGSLMNQQLVAVNESFFQQFNLSSIRIMILYGQNTLALTKKIYSFKQSPEIIVCISQEQEKQLNLDDKEEIIEQFFIRSQMKKNATTEYVKEFIKKVKTQKITTKQQVEQIHQQAKKQCLSYYSKFLIEIFTSKAINISIQFKQGTYKDLSPGYQGNHNLKSRMQNNQIALRRWEQLNIAFKHIQKNNSDQQGAYINVYGQKGSGKTYFIQQLCKILIERQKYNYGVYLLQGSIVAKKYDGDFEKYINHQSQKSKLPDLDQLLKCNQENLILVIDDFHLVKPKSNGLLKLFIVKLLKRKINVIVVTNDPKIKEDLLPGSLPIKIPKIIQKQINLIMYNIVNFSSETSKANLEQIRKYLKQGKATLKELMNFEKQKYSSIQESFSQNFATQTQMKKIHSQFT